MRRPLLRALMALVGVVTLAVYALGAVALYLLLRGVLRLGPSLPRLAGYLLVLTLVFAFVSYKAGTARVLRQLRAAPLGPDRAPALQRRVDALAAEMDVARPTLYVGEMGQPNALALGGGLGAGTVVVDRRLFRLLTLDELEAILAHELAHIEHRDSLVQALGFSALQTLVAVVLLALSPVLLAVVGAARATAWVRGRPGAWAGTLPGRVHGAVARAVSVGFFLLSLALLALSRHREFAADDRAAAVTGQPLALARALEKMERATDPAWGLLSPLYTRGDEEGLLTRLLSTHPATDERVRRLRERAGRTPRAAPRQRG